ncbi:hypothetical protein N7520_007933 [Penicillium odoratum]|uniref:uncharacterized protein n=1 Tax=Penicillium odoratum TaxID=1167516 RepID=UPI0025496359|nr:uncharacterized protein N7520_007933 [Penicillium odoratum]KAJ5760777.1 hypothetical protein N7520_007933 [Penicillium odoratum]
MENRTYLWLHLTLHIIEENPSLYGRRSDVEALLEDLPDEVSAAYERILARSNSLVRTEALLRILLAAMEPLTLDEANMALTTVLAKQNSQPVLVSDMWPSEVFKNIVKDLCGLLVNFHGSKLVFMHQTAREILSHRERQGEWKGRLDMLESHRQMLLICLDALSCVDKEALGEIYTHPEFYWGELRGKGCFSGHNSRILRELETNFPLALYSTRHWIDHAKPTEMETLQEFWSFLSDDLAYEAWDALHHMLTAEHQGYKRYLVGKASPLYHASFANLPCLAKWLLKNGADINAEGYLIPTALYVAAQKGHREIMELLLEHNAGINTRSQPLVHSVFPAPTLLSNNAEIDSKIRQGGRIALLAASAQGQEDMVRLLLENGADPLLCSFGNGYSIHAASHGNHIGIVKLLLERGADANSETDIMKDTPLYIASHAGFKELATVLIEGGAHINKLSGTLGSRKAALITACMMNHLDMVELLLEKGADVNIQGADFALHCACKNDYLEMVQLLVKYGADVNIKGNYGNALAYSCSLDIVQFLIIHGADVNAKGEASNALVRASEQDHLDIVLVLIETGADVDAKGRNERHGNALFKASCEGNYEIVELLLESGADADSEEPPLNALRAAREAQWDDVTALLLQYGAQRRRSG